MDNAPITLLLVVVTCLVSWRAFEDRILMQRLIFYPYAIQERNEWYRFLSSGFIHADWMHLLFNMIALYSFGQNVENALVVIMGKGIGSALYVALYFVSKIGGGIPTFINHRYNATYRALGASGAVSGVVFASIFFFPLTGLLIFPIPIPLPAVVFGFAYLAYSSYMSRHGNDNIGHDAHFGGAVTGFAFMLIWDQLACDGYYRTAFLQQIMTSF